MSRAEDTLAPDYFEDIYRDSVDPWEFATSEYERDKYDATLEALPAARYASGFEVGCSVGVLSRRLSGRCDALLSVDVIDRVLDAARARNADRPNLRFERRFIPADWPEGTFDLIVLSEVLYYLGAEDLARTARLAEAGLRPGGDMVLVHWLGPTDYPLSGEEAATRFITATQGFAAVTRVERTERYRLDLLHRG